MFAMNVVFYQHRLSVGTDDVGKDSLSSNGAHSYHVTVYDTDSGDKC